MILRWFVFAVCAAAGGGLGWRVASSEGLAWGLLLGTGVWQLLDSMYARSLPNYVFISPNLCHDMHNCPVQTGDAWLSQQVPTILSSPAFTTQNSLLVITWDEGEGDNNTVSTIFAGPAARKSHESAPAYNHYSLLHTIESLWGLEPLTDNDKNAPIMTDMLK